MGSGLENRKQLFEELLNINLDENESKKEKQNNAYWEMLCCASKPLVPFIGAGISAWCYKTWKGLLESITKEVFPEKCFDIVKEALTCEEKPDIQQDNDFYWMEEIAECIFEEDREAYKNSQTKFKIKETDNNNEITKATEILKRLRSHIGEEADVKKRDARKALYREFDKAHLKEKGTLPEYQRYFPILFPDLLITTNYDHALECCYPSILNYSYNDLEKKNKNLAENMDGENTKKDRSWLYQAVCGKLENMNQKLNGKEISTQEVTIPDMPMLLKLHGSIEKVNDIALARIGYEKAYAGEMPELIEYIYKNSTMLFLGYSLNDDRIMAKLKKCKEDNEDRDIHHFAFLPIEEKKNIGRLEKEFGIYPIYFDKRILNKYYNEKIVKKCNYFDYFLGLLLENLARRKKKYPQPLELLWEKKRFSKNNGESMRLNFWKKKSNDYIRYEEARQIWKNLNDANNIPIVAIVGEEGYGKSTLCRSIQTLQENDIDPFQFFFIDLRSCKTWEEFCIRVYEELNMIELEIQDISDWKRFAEKVSDRCDVYWKSVLVLDHIDGLIDNRDNEIWKVLKNILMYWSRKKTRIIFVCGKYPEGIPCYIWDLKELKIEEKKQLFFSVCTSSQSRDISYLEKKVVGELFYKQSFRPQSITLLGKYANSKNDLTSLLEEWTMYYEQGDSGDYTIAWIFWYHLLDEHHYYSINNEQKNRIQDNLLWVWEILGDYPGLFPTQFFELLTYDVDDYRHKDLTKKTLMLMKNIGLCEEKVDEEQMILFGNMNDCVNDYFLEFVKSNNPNSIIKTVSKDLEDDEEYFHGYRMHGWSVKLKQYIYKELKQSVDKDNGNNRFHSDPVFNILQLLYEVSRKVDTSQNRIENKKLDIVLHYEIKNIVHFLCSCFSRMETKGERGGDNTIVKMVIDTVYNYSYYYQFIPNYSYSLVEYILNVIGTQGNQKNETEEYKVAQLNLVRGDIQRLLGRKIAAKTSYQRALSSCNKLIVEELSFDNSNKNIYSIKASAMLAIDCYVNECELEEGGQSGKSLQIYETIDDELGVAYWYQRKGEILNEKVPEYEEASSNSDEQEIKYLEQIKEIYEVAIKKYEDCNYETGIAYTNKCKGDVLVKLMKLEGDLTKKEKYFYEAVKMYWESYECYCKNINWRGFANVIQAMETCCRYFDSGKSNEKLEGKLYSYAEECYRWLGDIRGLADTLDYTGHEYAERGYNYKALSFWGESKDLWKILDNNKKVEQMEKKIVKLRKNMDSER